MTKMSKNYPVMQILGYRGIDRYSSQLIRNQEEFTLYPGVGGKAKAMKKKRSVAINPTQF